MSVEDFRVPSDVPKYHKPTCLIFGGTGGIGRSISPTLSERYDVILLDSRTDILYDSKVKEVLLKHKPQLVISMVGINNNGPIHKNEPVTTAIEMERMINGHMSILRNALPYMRDNKYGRIIFASSVLSEKMVFGTGVYSTCKAAIERMARQAAFENAKYNITVNTLRLGYFDAGIIKSVPQPMLEKIIEEIPGGKLGDAMQIAEVIKTIVDCSYINGATIPMDGAIKR